MEINFILKLIPKYTARKVQDLKKNYKYNEDYENLASSFLYIFSELDRELGQEAISLRKKKGDIFTYYLSNSIRILKVFRNLPNLIESVRISEKSLNSAISSFEAINKENLSSNYRDLHDFMYFIIDYYKKNKKLISKSSVRSCLSTLRLKKTNGEALTEFSDTFSNKNLMNTYDKRDIFERLDTKIDTSFSNYIQKPLTCSNKKSQQDYGFSKIKTQRLLIQNNENKKTSEKSLLKNVSPWKSSRINFEKQDNSSEKSFSLRKNNSRERKNDWEEIRRVKII